MSSLDLDDQTRAWLALTYTREGALDSPLFTDASSLWPTANRGGPGAAGNPVASEVCEDEAKQAAAAGASSAPSSGQPSPTAANAQAPSIYPPLSVFQNINVGTHLPSTLPSLRYRCVSFFRQATCRIGSGIFSRIRPM